MLTLWGALVILHSAMAIAQMDTALLVGRVVDSSGTIIVKARVELVDVDRNSKTTVQTNRTGLYIFPAIRPSHYRVEVSAPGYRTASATLTILVQDDVQQNFSLSPGTAPEPVITGGNGAPVGTTGTVGTVVDQTLVKELPLNGRSFQTLFQLTPGVVITPTTFASQGQFSVNGQRTNANYFIIDGASANVGIAAGVNPGQSAGGSLPALSAFGGTNSLVSTDDVQEFAMLTSSYAAEFGRMPGAQISIVTRAGTNEFHGEAFDYIRNDALDANDWFANRDNLKRAALRQNDYGGVFGGPLIRNKTFFLTSYEGIRLRQPTSIESEVPSVSSRNDAPTAIKPFLDAYPLPNGPDEGNDLAHASYAFSNPSSLDTISLRVDHLIGEPLSIFARFNLSISDRKQRGAAINSLSTVTDTHFGLQTVTAGLTYRGSSTFINDVRFNWSRSSASGRDKLDGFGGAVPLRPEIVFPSTLTDENSLFQFIPAANADIRQLVLGREVANVQAQINITDNLSYQIRSHLLKTGLDFRILAPKMVPALYAQEVLFNDIRSALSLKNAFIAIASSVPVHSSFRNYSAYLQDTWRVVERLSVAYGLRWDYSAAPSGRAMNGQQPFAMENINDLPALAFAPTGAPIYRSTIANFAPRLGFAYEVRRSSRTGSIIRAGAGRFYDLGNGPAGNAFDGTSFPFSALKLIFGSPFPLSREAASPPSIPATPPFRVVAAFPSVLKMPYTWQWNLTLQQSLGEKQTLTMSYLGASGHGLLRSEEYIGGVAGVPEAFTQVLFTNNAGYSNYNALQVQFRRRASTVASIVASYSFSHSFDNVSTDSSFTGIPGQFLDPRVDYGSSDFDIRNAATVGVDYSPKFAASSHVLNVLGRGWAVDSIVVIHSSPPVNVTVSRDIGFGVYDFRPDVIPGMAMYVDDPRAAGGRRLNSLALYVPTTQRQGSLTRNAFRGFPLAEADLAIRRIFRLGERLSMETRVEAFNLFNHPSFSPESGAMGRLDSNGMFIPRSGFGLSEATLAQGLAGGQLGAFGTGFSPLYQIGGARSLQLVMKLEF